MKKHIKSIIQHEETCFLCGRKGVLQVHHCLHGTARRKLADQDGLVVYLCHHCHRELHDKGIGDLELQQHAEEVWIEQKYFYDHTKGVQKFIQRYGKNYLDVKEA